MPRRDKAPRKRAEGGPEEEDDEGGDVELGGGVSPSEDSEEEAAERVTRNGMPGSPPPTPPRRKSAGRKYGRVPRSSVVSSYLDETDEAEGRGRKCCGVRLPFGCSPCRELRDCVIALVVLYWAVMQLVRKHGLVLSWPEWLSAPEAQYNEWP